MAQWYKNNRKLFWKEMEILSSTCPLLRLAIMGPGFKINEACSLKRESAIVHGTYILQVPDSTRQIEYGIVLVIPENYPKAVPQMFCNDPKLPIGNIDRHIMKDGRACLGVQAEIGMYWPPGSTIVDFLDKFVAPFLAWQFYYDVFQRPPPWGARPHGKQGILEFYGELLGIPADSSTESIEKFMELLARKNQPGGHEPCPCGSGKKLRNCHRELVYEVRKRVARENVKDDLRMLKELNKPK